MLDRYQGKTAVMCLFVFMTGFVAALQLTKLVPANDHYEGSWIKFAFAILLAVFFSAGAIQRKR